MLVWRTAELSPNQIEKVIRSEVLDENDSELRRIVIKNIVHGP